MNLFWIYAFNILINSALAFATIALLVKFLLWAFRIQHPRMVALCLSLPLFKVAFDFFLYNSSRWALSSEINPLLCAPGTRAITATLSYPLSSGIYFSVEGGKTFTVADVIALSVDPLWIKITVLLVFSVSTGLCSLGLLQALRARKGVKELLVQASPCLRSVSALIQRALKNTKIFTSTEVEVPCAFHRTIIFPEKLIEKLSQSEFEAIVVHELDHLRWKDSALRSAQHILATLFWWIPTKKWLSRLSLSQELACDAKISKFNLLPIDLASAIAKAARGAQKSSPCLPVMFFVEKGQLLSRVKLLVNPAKKRPFGVRMLQAFFAFSLLTVLFFGQFWIF
ncbi:MAG TPA: M56 family metallopeptidase [Rhabdochlamydiaceae bacterium]|nr:M56 family metallopeptidase [Rhabdochlamydiaceae bacterium]